jgi:hypothetical protein
MGLPFKPFSATSCRLISIRLKYSQHRSAVGEVTAYGLNDEGIGVRVPART